MSTKVNPHEQQFITEKMDDYVPSHQDAGFTTNSGSLIVKTGKEGQWIMAKEDTWIEL